MTDDRTRPDEIREPWSRSGRKLPRLVVRPLQTFLNTEAASGIMLLAAAVVALVWANSPFSGSYEDLWHKSLSVTVAGSTIEMDLRHWINEGLMAVFFFVVGLEIKREIVTGELRDPRAAALPVVAAIGGMVVPAGIYALINAGGSGARGWGIPMATDIAFALGILTIAGRRLPASLKLFLLALAIVDDLGAIIVIALFYSGGIAWDALGLTAALLLMVTVLQRIGVRAQMLYAFLGVAVWISVYNSGLHATLAGVVLGLLTPTSPFQRPRAVSEEARRVADETVDDPSPPDQDAHQWLWLQRLAREAVSPLGRLEHMLHPWTSFVIIPLFALANAGVDLGGGAIADAATNLVAVGIVAGLVVGKIAGISLSALLAAKAGFARLPPGVRWSEITGVAAVAGVGFTVSLFVAGLAFEEGTDLDVARIGILAGSLIAGVTGSVLLLSAARKRAA